MRQKIFNGLLLVSQLSLFSSHTFAFESLEPDLFDDIPVITSASRLNQSILSSPSAVTVIDRAMIEASGFIELADIFRLVPGFQVAHADGNTFAVVNHGNGWEYPSQMQLLVDGRSTYTSALSSIDWNAIGITIEDIERIEVVRGPAASAYGSNSFSGAINIVTRAPELDDKLQLGYRTGNNGERRLLLRHSNTLENFSYRVTGSKRDNGGFDDNLDSRHFNDFSLTSRYTLDTKNSFYGRFSNTNGEAGMYNIDRSNPTGFYDRDRSTKAWSAHLRWDHLLSDTEELKVNFFHNFHEEDDMTSSYPLYQFFNEDFGFNSPSDFNNARSILENDVFGGPIGRADQTIRAGERSYHSHRSDLEMQYSAVLDSGLQYVVGAGTRYDTMSSDAFFPAKGTESNSSYRAFANVQIPLSTAFTANLGGLFEKSNIVEDEFFSPRASLTWHLTDKQSIRTTYSKAYRMPSLLEKNMDVKLIAETGTLLKYEFVADDNLKPEEVRALDIGYLGQATKLPLSWELRAYREEYDNAIIFYRDEGFAASPDNKVKRIGNQAEMTLYGFEGALTYRPEQNSFIRFHFNRGHETGYEVRKINLDGNQGVTDYTDSSQNAPRKSYGILAAKAVGSWQFNAGLYHVGKMRWAGRGDEVDSYTRVDASISKRFRLAGSQELVLKIGGQNIGNSQYYEFINDDRYGLLYEPRYYASLTFLNF